MPRYLHEFLEIDGVKVDNGWWEIDGKYLVNIAGGHHDYVPTKDDIIIEADSWDDVNCDTMLSPNSQYGWVAPDGKFYGCNYSEHEMIARYVLKSTERKLEETYVKLYRPLFGGVEAYTQRTSLTEEQTKTLIDRGLTFCYLNKGVIDFDKL